MIGSVLRVMTPFLLAALGGLLTERVGALNIALEGLILIGAFFAVAAGAASGSVVVGLLAAMGAAGTVALLHALVAFRLRADVFVSGIATNLLASGLVVVLSERLYGQKGVVRFEAFPEVPRLGPALLSGLNVFVPLALVLAVAVWLLLERTPWGLRLRATGSRPEVVEAVGVPPVAYKMGGMIASGVLCGMAGASLGLPLQAVVPGLSAGRGWIALVIVYLGARNVPGIVLASALFGLAESLSNAAQTLAGLPTELALAIPFALSLLALVGYSAWQRLIEQGKLAPRRR